jgi:NAD-dependent deacetylase
LSFVQKETPILKKIFSLRNGNSLLRVDVESPMKKNIVILTGAGISAESGLPTFRDADGLWEGHHVEEVATPEAFERDPKLVHRFYNMRREALFTVEPNAAHLALAKLQREYPGSVTLVTQNVDDLHERGGSKDVIHMHGEIRKARCASCERVYPWDGPLDEFLVCEVCHRSGKMRPHIVWFGEMPFHMDEIEVALRESDLFIAIGTSGQVYPAAGFVATAKHHGATTIEINNAGTAVSSKFTHHRIGPATQQVPKLVQELLAGTFPG